MSLHVAKRMADIQPFHVMDLLAKARQLEAQGRSIIHMEIGEPDYDTPAPIIEAGRAALSAGKTHYTPALGLPELREVVAGFYQDRHGITIAPERVIITPGSSGALQLVMGVLVNPGEKVLMADPGYPCNRHFVRLFEGIAEGIAVTAADDYQLNVNHLEQHWDEQSVAALVATPSNPTGTMISATSLRAMSDFTQTQGGRLIVDEIYLDLHYDVEASTALAISDELFVISSFSKYFCMTGWRIGWMVAPQGYVRDIDKLAQNIFLAASTPAQHAALAAFKPEVIAELEQRRVEFQSRRDFLLPALRDLGFTIPVTPQGAFYLYADCSAFTNDSYQFTLDLLEQVGVAITPGLDFGHNRPGQHVRFAYTTQMDRLVEGVERLREYLKP